jgi:uncharacterized protein (DUF2267 family)
MSSSPDEAFTEQVRERSGLQDADAAQRAAIAVLEVLGGHLTGAAARRLGDGLPETFALPLRQTSETAQPGGLDEIYAEIERRSDPSTDVPAVVSGVARTLCETADPKAVESAREQLPAPLRVLLATTVEEGPTAQPMAAGPIDGDAPNVAGPDRPVTGASAPDTSVR